MSYYSFNTPELKDGYHNGGVKETEIRWTDVLLVEVFSTRFLCQLHRDLVRGFYGSYSVI